VAAGGALRLHTGQAIGILGGAIKAGDKAAGTGLTMIAGAGDVDVQAQAGTLQVAALNDLKIQSQSDNVNWASAKKITLSTAGGASIVIEGGNITFLCPGTITVHAGTKSFVSAASVSHPMPALPVSEMPDVPFSIGLRLLDMPGGHGVAPAGEPWRVIVVRAGLDGIDDDPFHPALFSQDAWDEVLFSGTTPADGHLPLTTAQQKALFNKALSMPGRVWLLSGLTAMPVKPSVWTTSSDAVNPRKIVDSLNIAPDGRMLDDTRTAVLAEHAKQDWDVTGVASLQPQTLA
jgi:type VI secretion system secreted protein VgrG